MNPNLGMMDRTRFNKAHSDTMYVHPVFPQLKPEMIRPDTFAYQPCWGILDPGMTMEKHNHAIPEFYVFFQGKGRMTLGEETFDVHPGLSVNIPSNVFHEVENDPSAVEPLVWLSIGLTEVNI